ncbi:MAG: 2-phosphosulfolactate phosphatase [Lachnospiraceae bacterium]|nr:2-phosphosulfolactate phosphatase [Lachnospiraceae bacterium]
MDIRIFHLIEGAKQAEGLTVIIDVFRAASLECYLYSMGVREIRPVGTIGEAFSWRERDPACILAGERGGRRCDGFDFGNSPSTVVPEAVYQKRIIHTTSAGTQGIINAEKADELLLGSLVNASATARYIAGRKPEKVSLVCMGNAGVERNPEDELCAGYLKSMLTGEPMTDFKTRLSDLRFRGGEHFFIPEKQEIFPEADFFMCIDHDRFDFVLKVGKDQDGFVTRRVI